MMEKHCRICGRVIAVRYEGEGRGGRYNAVMYCPDCAARVRKRQKAVWQKENRRDCRTANKELRRQARAARAYTDALEQAVEELRIEVQRLRTEARKKKGLFALR